MLVSFGATGMPLPPWPKTPEPYEEHKRVRTLENWISSKAKRLSLPPTSKAQYHPDRIPGLAVLERACIEDGIPLTDLDNAQRKQHKFYMDCRVYFGDQVVIAGYCDGEITPYILNNSSLGGVARGSLEKEMAWL
jgi:hypothetical protein